MNEDIRYTILREDDNLWGSVSVDQLRYVDGKMVENGRSGIIDQLGRSPLSCQLDEDIVLLSSVDWDAYLSAARSVGLRVSTDFVVNDMPWRWQDLAPYTPGCVRFGMACQVEDGRVVSDGAKIELDQGGTVEIMGQHRGVNETSFIAYDSMQDKVYRLPIHELLAYARNGRGSFTPGQQRDTDLTPVYRGADFPSR